MSTAAATSGADSAHRRDLQRYGTIVVVGGGCYGSYYVRQLSRAARAGALAWKRLLVVDRDARCAVASDSSAHEAPTEKVPALELVVSDWGEFFDQWLSALARPTGAAPSDAVVPSPLMPHLFFQWLLERARRRWPARTVESRPLDRPPHVPWQRAAPGGTHYVSFAEWMCPINCIEPAVCPEIRGPRTWSLPRAIRAYVEAERARGEAVDGPLLFHCTHRAYGVGMIDAADVLSADDRLRDLGERGAARVLVGTVSHCHGALDYITIK